MNCYYVDYQGKTVGPVSEEELRKLSAQGVIHDDTHVIAEGQSQWARYGDWRKTQAPAAAVAASADMYYYTDARGQSAGPCSPEQLQELLRQGAINASSWVLKQGQTNWQSLAAVFPQLVPPPTPPTPVQVVVTAPRPDDAPVEPKPAPVPSAPITENPISWILAGLTDAACYFPLLMLAGIILSILLVLTNLCVGIGSLIFGPPLMAGYWAILVALARGEKNTLNRIFDGFRVFWMAFLVGLIFDVLALVSIGVVVLVLVLPLMHGGNGNWWLPLLCILAVAYLWARLMFAMPLVVDRKLGAGEALGGSWRMTGRASFHAFIPLMMLFAILLMNSVCGLAFLPFFLPVPQDKLGGAILPGILLVFLVGLPFWMAACMMPCGHAYNSLLSVIGQAVPQLKPRRTRIGMVLLGVITVLGIAGGVAGTLRLQQEEKSRQKTLLASEPSSSQFASSSTTRVTPPSSASSLAPATGSARTPQVLTPTNRQPSSKPVEIARVDLVRATNLPTVLWKLDGLAVEAVAFSPNGRWLGGCCGDGSLRVWDSNSGEQLYKQQVDGAAFRCLAFSPDNQLLGAGTAVATIHVFDAATGAQKIQMKADKDAVSGIIFSATGRTLVSIHDREHGSPEFGIRTWEPRTGQMLGSPLPKIIGLSLSLSRNTGRLYVGRRGGISIIAPDTGDILNQQESAKMLREDAFGIAISPDDRYLMAGQQWGGAFEFDPSTLKDNVRFVIGERRYSTDAPRVMAFSPDGTVLACGTRGDIAHLWSAGNWQLLRILHPNGMSITFSPDGRRLANAGKRGLEIRDLQALVLNHPVENGLISPTGFWRGGNYSRVYFKLTGDNLDGWWESDAQGSATLKGEGKPATDENGHSVFEWTWTTGTDTGVGRLVIAPQGDRQAATFTCWRGNLRRGQPLDTATLTPVLGSTDGVVAAPASPSRQTRRHPTPRQSVTATPPSSPTPAPPSNPAIVAANTACAALAADPLNPTLLAQLRQHADKVTDAATQARCLAAYQLGCRLTNNAKEAADSLTRLAANTAGAGYLQIISNDNLCEVCTGCQGRGTVSTPCAACKGSGRCAHCKGSGRVQLTLGRPGTASCPGCSGNGTCRTCAGQRQLSNHCAACAGQGKRMTVERIRAVYLDLLRQGRSN